MQEQAKSAQRPNFVVILADDMGFSDIGCFGSEIATPNLDAMAGAGMRMTQMYNSARCCPTRACILTGLHPHQAGVGHMVGDYGVGPAYQGYLRQDCVTLGEALKRGGYRTLYSGKWHVSPGIPVVGEPTHMPGSDRNPTPRSRGFDRFYGTLAGCGSYFYPHGLMEQEQRITAGDDYYYTDAISEQACRMIRESADESFFLHVCYTAPHWPLHARPEDIEKYRGKYMGGWDALREGRHERIRAMGLLDARWPLSPRDEKVVPFEELPKDRQRWEDLRMAVYAAQVERMDRGIGQILRTLRELDLERETVVIFLSDNGGCAEFLNEDGDGKKWPSFYRHSARPGETCHVGNNPSLDPGPASTFMSYDLPWANASNTPFRLYKQWVHEGGISSPCVVKWPGMVAPGQIRHEACHIIDFMPTLLELAGVEYPKEYNGHAIQPMEGESFAPMLRGADWSRRSPLFWEHQGNCAMREGEWKLVSKAAGGRNGPWELYNMASDRTELSDLAGREPGRVERMAGAFRAWARRVGVQRWDRGPTGQPF